MPAEIFSQPENTKQNEHNKKKTTISQNNDMQTVTGKVWLNSFDRYFSNKNSESEIHSYKNKMERIEQALHLFGSNKFP